MREARLIFFADAPEKTKLPIMNTQQSWQNFEPWTTMFIGVRQIARNTSGITSGIRAAEQFALARPTLFDADYWNRCVDHKALPLATVVEWAHESWEALASLGLKPKRDDFLLLDLGDAPETFEVSLVQGRPALHEALLKQTFSDAELREFYAARHELTGYNVCCLHDPILSWNFHESGDHHGNNGDFLWLCVGALALLEPLREVESRRALLQTRAALPIVCGFESLFCPLALATPDVLIFPDSTRDEERREELAKANTLQPELPF